MHSVSANVKVVSPLKPTGLFLLSVAHDECSLDLDGTCEQAASPCKCNIQINTD